jgi:UDP-GlcNAc3NAcA epimerase
MTSNIKKILTIVGARPQFIKAAVISRLIIHQYKEFEEVMVHTGQHFDQNMSKIFFEELEIKSPKYSLDINNVSHGEMIGQMIIELEKILIIEKPSCVLVYGDTNSTLAGAIAAKKLNIPVAHIEAGVRNYDESMPEESNRYLVDRLAEINFCCTDLGIINLKDEGYLSANLNKKVYMTGDLMYDAALYESSKDLKISNFSREIIESPNSYILTTIHRASNTDNETILESIITNLNSINNKKKIIMLAHPRTRAKLKNFNIIPEFPLHDPVGYYDTLQLIKNSSLVITDSGGLVREAYFFNKKSLLLLDNPLWPELIESKACVNVPPLKMNLFNAFQEIENTNINWPKYLFGDGNAGNKILDHLKNFLGS